MLTLITGNPGAGKSLHAVWEFARHVPGSTIESNGQAVPRRLLSNIRNLLVDHEPIDAAWMGDWHNKVQPGDVILYDEVQEVWRPRANGSAVPECVQRLEVHRHMGVDIILVTQHPMLLDQNVRRLVNQHLHLRRITKRMAMLYEWDHCGTPGQFKTCLQSKLWRHPKGAYELYTSAQLHTKTTARMPRIALVGVLALAVAGVAVPAVLERVKARFAPQQQAQANPEPVKVYDMANPPPGFKPLPTASPPKAAASGASGLPQPAAVAEVRPMGCIASAVRCDCYAQDGVKLPVPEAACREGSYRVGWTVPARETTVPDLGGSRVVTPVPPSRPVGELSGMAPAGVSLPS